jgi:23S rRNA-/tRNA-specific pseudouridylate synthase
MQWTVHSGEGSRVGDIVDKMHAMGAPSDARVYLNGRRAELDEPVDQGDVVELWPLRQAPPREAVGIVAQRDGVILAYKPAGVPTETTQLGEDSLLSALLVELNGGSVHAASRLDVGVSGLVLCTLGPDAARRLHRLRDLGQIVRRYLAISKGLLQEDEGIWDVPLGRDRDRAGRHRASPHARQRRDARTRYVVRERATESCLLELAPQTGRMHQLRAHAALAGAPIYGDRLYGGPTRMVDGSGRVTSLDRIALHAWSVELPGLAAEVPLPESLRALWARLAGLAIGD